MFDPGTSLLSRLLESCVVELQGDPTSPAPWDRAHAAVKAVGTTDADLAAAVEAKDYAALRAIVEAWDAGKRALPELDMEVMRRAMKAFRKSMKVTRLDDESKIGRNPMTDGGGSSILGITAPPRFSRDVWSELVRRGELRGGRQGVYELAKE
ncbi:MAG: hypothetical protein SGI72_14215 [Planctomycetota bacterium]|nr:hypothetical protein [Planctomycetota bacterium]